eukprot:4726123-Amphidinium_carterae.1
MEQFVSLVLFDRLCVPSPVVLTVSLFDRLKDSWLFLVTHLLNNSLRNASGNPSSLVQQCVVLVIMLVRKIVSIPGVLWAKAIKTCSTGSNCRRCQDQNRKHRHKRKPSGTGWG